MVTLDRIINYTACTLPWQERRPFWVKSSEDLTL